MLSDQGARVAAFLALVLAAVLAAGGVYMLLSVATLVAALAGGNHAS